MFPFETGNVAPSHALDQLLLVSPLRTTGGGGWRRRKCLVAGSTSLFLVQWVGDGTEQCFAGTAFASHCVGKLEYRAVAFVAPASKLLFATSLTIPK